MSAHTRRFVRCTWALDADLAYARHYPAVSWHESSSRDAELLADRHALHHWHALDHDREWGGRREWALRPGPMLTYLKMLISDTSTFRTALNVGLQHLSWASTDTGLSVG